MLQDENNLFSFCTRRETQISIIAGLAMPWDFGLFIYFTAFRRIIIIWVFCGFFLRTPVKSVGHMREKHNPFGNPQCAAL